MHGAPFLLARAFPPGSTSLDVKPSALSMLGKQGAAPVVISRSDALTANHLVGVGSWLRYRGRAATSNAFFVSVSS